MSGSWLQFWNRPHRIYVSERHRRLHYARIADDILTVLPRKPGLRMLDFGCGDALDATRIADRVGQLYLYDAAAAVRAGLTARFAGHERVRVLDQIGDAQWKDEPLDFIVVFSVIQYISRPELPALLQRMRRWLAPDGLLLLADVIPPEAGLVDDVRALLLTAARHGFLPAALYGLAVTAFSDYRRLRRRLGLSIYTEAEIFSLLREAGFAAERHHRNLGFHPVRRTYLARRL